MNKTKHTAANDALIGWIHVAEAWEAHWLGFGGSAPVRLARVDKAARLNSWPTARIALSANGLHIQWLAIVAVVILAGDNAAIDTSVLTGAVELPAANSDSYGGVRLLRGAAGLTGFALVVGVTARNQFNDAALNALKTDGASHLDARLIGCSAVQLAAIQCSGNGADVPMKQSHGLNSGVAGDAAADLPKRRERNAGQLRQPLQISVPKRLQLSANFRNRRD